MRVGGLHIFLQAMLSIVGIIHDMTEERQKGRDRSGLPDATGFKAPKFIYEIKKNMYFETRSAAKYGVLIESPKFIYGDYLLPSAFSTSARMPTAVTSCKGGLVIANAFMDANWLRGFICAKVCSIFVAEEQLLHRKTSAPF